MAVAATFDRLAGPIDRLAERCSRIVLSRRGVLAVWLSLFFLLWLARTFLYIGASADEAEQIVYTQRWRWGYAGHSPPLFTWILNLAQAALGLSVGTVVFVKYAMLGASYALIFLIAQRMLCDERLAALAALSPLAMFYTAWYPVFHYTHSVLLIFSVCLTFYLLLRLKERGTLCDYLLFGVGIGVGLLSKYNYPLFLLALLAAAMTEATARARILDRRIVTALAVGLIIAAPHFLWLARSPGKLVSHIEDRFSMDLGSADVVSFSIARMIEAPAAALMVLLPLILFLVLFFPRACLPLGRDASAGSADRRLLGATLLIILVAVTIGTSLLDMSRVRHHHMFVLILFPVCFLARAEAAGIGERAINRFGMLMAALAIIVGVAVLAKYPLDPHRDGRKAYFNVPYAVLAQQLRTAGFERGSIVADWHGYPLAGNLRPYFPDSRVINLLDWTSLVKQDIGTLPILESPDRPWIGQCLLIWSQPGESRRPFIFESARLLLSAELPEDLPSAEVAAEMPPASGRTAQFFYALVPEGSGYCR